MDTYKFPSGGYDVEIYKKQDIIDSITDPSIDKDLLLSIVEECESDIVQFILNGRWTGIPFIGNIRIPKIKQLEETPEQQAVIQEAKANLTAANYALFRKQLGKENSKHIKDERLYKYITSISVSHNKKVYKRLCLEKGEAFARVHLYATYNVTIVSEVDYNLTY